MPDDPAKPNVASMFAALGQLFKAIPNEKLADIKDVTDLWNSDGEHSNPSSAQILTGPAETMRGGNAGPMVGRHSSFAPQSGMTAQYDAFNGLTPEMRKSIENSMRKTDTLVGVVSDIAKNQQAIGAAIEKYLADDVAAKAAAATAAAEAAKKADEPLDADSFLGKAVMKITKARNAYRKAELEDEDKIAQRKSYLEEAGDHVKAAKRLLSKAEDDDDKKSDEDKMEKAVSDVRSIGDRITKAQAEITKAEDDKAEEDKKEKEADAAKKASEEAAAAEAAKKAAGGEGGAGAGTEGDGTAKAGITREEMQKALDNMTAINETTIKGFMETIMNASRVSPPNLQVIKGVPMMDLEARIEAAMDSNLLATPAEATAATTLLHRSRLADADRYPRERLQQDIAAAPDKIRQLFVAA